MIRINKDLCMQNLKSTANMNLTLSLVIKGYDGSYINGDDVGLHSITLSSDDWDIKTDSESQTCSLISKTLEWVSARDRSVEVVGYFVFNESSVLFYDVFKNGVVLEKGHPFTLSPCLTMKYHAMDNDFLNMETP